MAVQEFHRILIYFVGRPDLRTVDDPKLAAFGGNIYDLQAAHIKLHWGAKGSAEQSVSMPNHQNSFRTHHPSKREANQQGTSPDPYFKS